MLAKQCKHAVQAILWEFESVDSMPLAVLALRSRRLCEHAGLSLPYAGTIWTLSLQRHSHSSMLAALCRESIWHLFTRRLKAERTAA